MQEDSLDDGADGARTRSSGSVEEVADALQMRTPADIMYLDELRVGQTSILVKTVLLSAQGHRLRRIFALSPDLTFKRKAFDSALAVVVQRNPSWAFDHTECLEFKRFVAKGLMVICRHKPQALKRLRRPAWVLRLLFTNPLSCEIDDQAGLDEGEQLASDQLPTPSEQFPSPRASCHAQATNLHAQATSRVSGRLWRMHWCQAEAMRPSNTHFAPTQARTVGEPRPQTRTTWSTDISPQSQPFDPAMAKWPDGCTFIVPEILSLTCQTWKTEDEDASCTKRRKREPHFQGRTKSGAEVAVKTTPQAKRDPLVILYVGAKQKCNPKVRGWNPGPRVCREHHDAPCSASLLQIWTRGHVQHEGGHCR